jgi:hypothetical protein
MTLLMIDSRASAAESTTEEEAEGISAVRTDTSAHQPCLTTYTDDLFCKADAGSMTLLLI